MAPLATEKVEVSDKGRIAFEWTLQEWPGGFRTGTRIPGPIAPSISRTTGDHQRIQVSRWSGSSRRYAPGSTLQMSTTPSPARSHISRSSRGVKHAGPQVDLGGSPASLRTSVRSWLTPVAASNVGVLVVLDGEVAAERATAPAFRPASAPRRCRPGRRRSRRRPVISPNAPWHRQIAASNSSSNGSARASSRSNVAPGGASGVGEIDEPLADVDAVHDDARARPVRSAWRPGPQPTSSTRVPGSQPSASTRKSTSCACPW